MLLRAGHSEANQRNPRQTVRGSLALHHWRRICLRCRFTSKNGNAASKFSYRYRQNRPLRMHSYAAFTTMQSYPYARKRNYSSTIYHLSARTCSCMYVFEARIKLCCSALTLELCFCVHPLLNPKQSTFIN